MQVAGNRLLQTPKDAVREFADVLAMQASLPPARWLRMRQDSALPTTLRSH